MRCCFKWKHEFATFIMIFMFFNSGALTLMIKHASGCCPLELMHRVVLASIFNVNVDDDDGKGDACIRGMHTVRFVIDLKRLKVWHCQSYVEFCYFPEILGYVNSLDCVWKKFFYNCATRCPKLQLNFLLFNYRCFNLFFVLFTIIETNVNWNWNWNSRLFK